MALVVSANGHRLGLEYLVNKAKPQDLTLRLYGNDVVPIFADSVSRYMEIRGAGYVPVVMAGANWTVMGGDKEPTTGSYPEQIFTFKGAVGSVYGYFITRSISGDLVWAEKFIGGPYEIKNSGDQIKVTALIGSWNRKGI